MEQTAVRATPKPDSGEGGPPAPAPALDVNQI